jgi:hypothetical protein
MIDRWPRVVSLYNFRRLFFYTRIPAAHRTLNIPENHTTVETFNANFKAKSVEIVNFLTFIGLFYVK